MLIILLISVFLDAPPLQTSMEITSHANVFTAALSEPLQILFREDVSQPALTLIMGKTHLVGACRPALGDNLRISSCVYA